MYKQLLSFLCILIVSSAFSQDEKTDTNNREIIFAGYFIDNNLDSVGGLQIQIEDQNTGEKLGTFISDADGFYSMRVPARTSYRLFITAPSSADIHFAVIVLPTSTEEILFVEQYINLINDKNGEVSLMLRNLFGLEMKIELKERALKS